MQVLGEDTQFLASVLDAFGSMGFELSHPVDTAPSCGGAPTLASRLTLHSLNYTEQMDADDAAHGTRRTPTQPRLARYLACTTRPGNETETDFPVE